MLLFTRERGLPLVCHWYATGMPLVCHSYKCQRHTCQREEHPIIVFGGSEQKMWHKMLLFGHHYGSWRSSRYSNMPHAFIGSRLRMFCRGVAMLHMPFRIIASRSPYSQNSQLLAWFLSHTGKIFCPWEMLCTYRYCRRGIIEQRSCIVMIIRFRRSWNVVVIFGGHGWPRAHWWS